MARTANRWENNATPSKAKTWNLAKYIRLSKEDEKKIESGRDNSNSVENQTRLLDEFHLTYADEFTSGETYIDDGCSGTDTNREGFQRLLADILAKRINCVVVKDLSRLARNYSDAGSLIDNLFVQMDVRFISLMENIDSHKNPDSVTSMLVPITNVFNENFCAQTSKKIRQVFDYKRRNGDFIGAFAPYGYAKNPKDRHSFVIDDEAAEVVRLVFGMFLDGRSKRAIAAHLNNHGILSPADYKRSKGFNYNGRKDTKRPALWYERSIDTLLRNRVYTGDMVQGKRRVKSYKVHTVEIIPEDEWIVVEDTHEAIITAEDFGKVQNLLKRDTRTSPKQNQLYLFSGFLRCADCGRSMGRSNTRGNVIYRCTTYSNCSSKACTSHYIRHNRLEAAVLCAVKQMVHLAVSYSELIASINESPQRKTQAVRVRKDISAREAELAKVMGYKQSAYEDWKDRVIDQDEYRHMKEGYDGQVARLRTVISTLKEEMARIENGIDTESPFLESFRKHQNIERLSREVLVELVDCIKVYDNGDISVKFKFKDELQLILEYIKDNKIAV